MYVCLSVTLLLQIDSSFLFLDEMEPFFGTLQNCFSSIFDLGPQTPKFTPQHVDTK